MLKNIATQTQSCLEYRTFISASHKNMPYEFLIIVYNYNYTFNFNLTFRYNFKCATFNLIICVFMMLLLPLIVLSTIHNVKKNLIKALLHIN